MQRRPTNKQEVLQMVEELDVRFVRMQFTDILGVIKNVDIPVAQLEKALDGNLMFDGSSIEGFVRIEESDMLLDPDPSSFTIFPWSEGEGATGRLMCDIRNPDGTPFAGDPRGCLKRVLDEARAMGFSQFNVGPEPEFFLFPRDADGKPVTRPTDQAGYFDLGPVDKGEETRRDITLALQKMGFEIEMSHHEVAPGQHEIDFKYADAVSAADNIATFRFVVRTIATQRGLHATFMPKPIHGIAGSGMHLHCSLFRDGENAFFDPKRPHQLSDTCMHFIAGILAHARGFSAITNPLVNSYKRLVPGYEAPVYIAWSHRNRSPLVRIPARRGIGTRIELRSPDPSCNPYLALAVVLKAGLEGIRRRLEPPASVDRNIYRMSLGEREELGIAGLPRTLGEALQEFENDPVVQEALGDHIASRFLEAKQIEWEIYRSQVHPWETDQYINIF